MMEFRRAKMEDGVHVLESLRAEQRATIVRLELDAMKLLDKVLDETTVAIVIDGEVASVFGITRETLLSDAKVWMVTTALIEDHPIEFLRASRRITHELYIKHGPLIGMVDANFERSRQWLRWIGFHEVRGGDFILMRYTGGH